MNDYYRILKVAPHASSHEIRKAFRKEVKHCHPDLYHSASTEEKKKLQKQFVLLSQAYDTLSNPKLRQEYDLKFQQSFAQQRSSYSQRASTHAKPPPFTRPQSQQTPPFSEPTDETLDDLLAEVEGLLKKFGTPFRDPLEILVQWALKVFQEFAAAWKEEEPETFQKTSHSYQETKHSMFEEIEEELQKLKAQQHQKRTKTHSRTEQSQNQPPPNLEIDHELEELKKKYGKSTSM